MTKDIVPASAEGLPKVDRAGVMRTAWSDYHRDVKLGWGISRNAPFSREHFAYCLRMAWAVAKDRAVAARGLAGRRADLIREACMLNNHPALVNVDHVTVMGMMDTSECERHVAKLRDMTKPRPSAKVVARIDAIRAEMLAMELGDTIPWAQHSALSAELFQLQH